MYTVKHNLEIDLLRALVAIADTGSFSTAAAQLGRTQSAVSLQIKRLESAVGQALLVRRQGRVAGPTAEGQVLIEYGRRILRLNDEAYSCFSRPALAGRLRLGMPEEFMESVFPPVLATFSRTFPRVELSVRTDVSSRLAALVEAGELDLVIAKRVADSTLPQGPEWRVLRREPLVWCAGEGSNASEERPLPIAVFHEGCAFRMAAITALAGAAFPWRAAFVGSSFTAMRNAVYAGLAITPLPRSLVRDGLVELSQGLPVLPETELVTRFAPGDVLSSAQRLLSLFEAGC